MPEIRTSIGGHVAFLHVAGDYKPGDLPPSSYLDWHEWADVQHAAGIKQIECGKCGKWMTPQELSKERVRTEQVRIGKRTWVEGPSLENLRSTIKDIPILEHRIVFDVLCQKCAKNSCQRNPT